MNNPMQVIGQISQFAKGYNGNAEEEARKAIKAAGLNQQQLNELQMQANELYSFAKQMGIMK